MQVFNLTSEEYVWSAVDDTVFLPSTLFHHHVAAHRCGLSILPECHQRREQRSGAHVVLQLSHAKYILKHLLSVEAII